MRSPLREAGRLLQIPIELLCFSLTVVQSPFTTLSCLGVSKRDVLIARVIIHAYNQHVRLLSPEPMVLDKPQSTRVSGAGVVMQSSAVLELQMSGKSGGLNGSTQHFLGVYSQESENLKFLVGVDLGAALLCSDPTGNSRLGLRSSGSIVVRVRLYFRSSRVARDSADHRSRLAHRWPP